MIFLRILYVVISIAGLGTFYYLMVIQKGSPQRLLGKEFKMPDVRLHYTPELLYNTYEDAGEDGRRQMRLYWLYDFGLIACLLGVMIAVSANIVDERTWVYPLMVWLTIARNTCGRTGRLIVPVSAAPLPGIPLQPGKVHSRGNDGKASAAACVAAAAVHDAVPQGIRHFIINEGRE